MPGPFPLLLKHKHALGDTVLFTALARDIHRAYPDKYDIVVDSSFSEVWDHNPNARLVTTKDRKTKPVLAPVEITYKPGIRAASRGQKVHMLSWFHRDFAEKTGIPVPVTEPKGDIHIGPGEQTPIIGGRYWLVVAGGKRDFTIKYWWFHRWQEVIDRLKAAGIWCVQAGVMHSGHHHPKLSGVIDAVGKYPSSRDFFNLIRFADGVICPVTAAMHISACFDKPCVVLAGGGEEPWWEGYTQVWHNTAFGQSCSKVKVEHRFLHTQGLLPCCTGRGCWKKKVVPLSPADSRGKKARELCVDPIRGTEQAVGHCMDLIVPEHVVEAVMSYYKTGDIPPIKPTIADVPMPQRPATTDPPPIVHTRTADPPSIVRPPAKPKVAPAQLAPPAEYVPKTIDDTRPTDALRVLDHPTLGGKMTVFVLCYGPHPELAKRCLDSIYRHVPAARLDVRVGCNAVADETLDYLDALPLTKVYNHASNDLKYPLMREMFHDASCPIRTNYLTWFDDDTFVVDPNWLVSLSNLIVANHPHGGRIYGWKMLHDLNIYAKKGHNSKTWFERATWWQGRHLAVRGRPNTEAPNGSVIPFVVGWCWAMAAACIKQCDIPDPRIQHNGDPAISEQVRQAGHKIVMWNANKSCVSCPTRERGGRRGYSSVFPWAPTAKPVAVSVR